MNTTATDFCRECESYIKGWCSGVTLNYETENPPCEDYVYYEE